MLLPPFIDPCWQDRGHDHNDSNVVPGQEISFTSEGRKVVSTYQGISAQGNFLESIHVSQHGAIQFIVSE